MHPDTLGVFVHLVGQGAMYALMASWCSIGLYLGYRMRTYQWLWPVLVVLAVMYMPTHAPDVSTEWTLEDYEGWIIWMVMGWSPLLGWCMRRTGNIVRAMFWYGISIMTIYWCVEAYWFVYVPYESMVTTEIIWFFTGEKAPAIYGQLDGYSLFTGWLKILIGWIAVPLLYAIRRHERTIG